MDPDYESDNDGHSLKKAQGNDIVSASRRDWERNSLPVKHYHHLDKGGCPKVVSHLETQAGGNKDFEKDHRADVSEKPSQGWGHASCDDKSAGFKEGKKDDVDKDVIDLCKGDGWGEELHDNKDIGRTESVDVKKVAVKAGSQQNGGWDVKVRGNTKNETWPGTSTGDDGWGEPESIGKRDAPGDDSWDQKMENCKIPDIVKKDNGWGGNGEKNRRDHEWEDKTVDLKRNNVRGSARSNYYGWESLEGGDGKSLGWGGKAGDNSKDDGWGDIAGDNSKDDGWGRNAGGNSKDDGWGGTAAGNGKDDGWGGKAGAHSKDDGWGGKAGAHGKDDDWKGNTRTGCREDGGLGGNTCSHSKDDGWESKASVHKQDGGWGGYTRSHSKEDGWGGNASAPKKDCGWGGNTCSSSKEDGWGSKANAHKKDGGWGGGWGDDTGTDSRNGGWGYCAGSSEKDREQGYGKEKGTTDSGWGNMGGSRREHEGGDHLKGVERNSSWRNRFDRQEGFSGADTRPPYRREGFSGGDTRPPYRDTEGFVRISGHTIFLPPEGRGLVPDVSTRSGLDGAGATRINEKEKIWYYQDPSKAIQGPFSMEQLRKWERTKLFPLDMKVWRATDGQDGSILLTDVLLGRICNDLPLPPGFGHHVQNSQGLSRGAPEDMKNAPVPRRSGSGCQDKDPRPKCDQDNFTGNDGTLADKWRHTSHVGSSGGARPWGQRGSDKVSPQDGGRDGSRGHWDQGANYRDYSEHHNLHRPGNDSRFRAQKKDFPCRYFARGGCKKGDECDFRH
ncbi:hypothetical protein GOP47_0029466 [Adiantum capillus-veneris]|nr:hypothetical protein GOP47_0029466 [Adiantum capillus-veneris]